MSNNNSPPKWTKEFLDDGFRIWRCPNCHRWHADLPQVKNNLCLDCGYEEKAKG